MKVYQKVAAALLIAVTACSDTVSSPVTESAPDLSPDLELVMPNFRPLATQPIDSSFHLASNSIKSGAPTFGIQGDGYEGNGSYGDPEIPDDYLRAATGALISRLEIDVGFMNDANVAFAQVIGESTGSFYKNHVLLKVRYGNTQVGENSATESESCLCLHLFTPWGRTVDTTVPVTGTCGHNSSATGTHEARLDFLNTGWELLNLASDKRSTSGVASQPECPKSGGSGSSNGFEDDEWYLCFWEDYYDSTGEFIRRQDLGCMPLNAT